MRLGSVAMLLALLSLPAGAQERTQYVLAISWQPAFCETRPELPECKSQTSDRFDAGNFSLHGLWPQPRSRSYCGVEPDTVRADKNGDWHLLPEPGLSADLRSELERVMPGTLSYLERHEWFKHGTCYGDDAEEYFSDSLAMLEGINRSAVAELFAQSIGHRLTLIELREAFDAAFALGAGERLRLSCVNDGPRRLISELTIGLAGEIDGPDSISDRLMDARPTKGGCTGGLVDPVGLQ